MKYYVLLNVRYIISKGFLFFLVLLSCKEIIIRINFFYSVLYDECVFVSLYVYMRVCTSENVCLSVFENL